MALQFGTSKVAFMCLILATTEVVSFTPANAATRFVDQASPNAVDAGAGSTSSPYRTLRFAVQQLKPGDRLVVRAGLYRDTIDLRTLEPASSSQPTIIEGELGATVEIRGSDLVTGWETSASGVFVKHGWDANSQQVFLDGKPLRQIGGTNFATPKQWPGRVDGAVSTLADGSFYYDQQERALYIKVPLGSLVDHTVEVSVRPYLLNAPKAAGLVVRNLSFLHSNTTAIARNGCVNVAGVDVVLENLTVSDCDGIGIVLHGTRNKLLSSRANRCGQLGMHINGKDMLLENNETNFNNTRGFNTWWEAGGIKFVGGPGFWNSKVLKHRAFENQGDGIWFDWDSRNVVVDGAVSAYNAGFGIHYEASFEGYITNSYTFGNALRGIYLPHSSRSVVANNLVVRNGMDGVVVVDENRRDPNLDLKPNDNRIVANIIGWNTRTELILPEDRLENTSDFNLFLDDSESRMFFSMGWATASKPVRRGLPAWRDASTQDVHSWRREMPMPQAVEAALKAKQHDIDWTSILNLASDLAVDPGSGSARARVPAVEIASRPGPRR